MKKKILLTGSAGFICSNYIRGAIFEKLPYDWCSIDKMLLPKSKSNYYMNKNHSFHIADITDDIILDKIFNIEEPNIIINFAAESHVDNSISNPNSFITTNILGTQNLLNCAKKYNISKFIQISTDEVYGSLGFDEPGWTEDSELNPRNPYSVSKASADMLVKTFCTNNNINFNITRCSNNYGPRQHTEKLIPKTIKSILENKPIIIYGQGAELRSWINVFDHCKAINTVLEKGSKNTIYNIDSHCEISNLELVNMICNIMGKGHDLISFIKDPRGLAHDYRYSMDTSRIEELGWKPLTNFKEGLSYAINWYCNNSWWFKA